MIFKTWFNSILLCSFFIGVTACDMQADASNDAPYFASLPKEAGIAYQNGKSILLYALRKNIEETEAYADWAEYLNDFSANKGANFHIIKISAADWKQLKIDSKEFSLFFKKNYPSYLYQGLIVEPQVYIAVYKRYTDQPCTEMDKAFLPSELK